MCAQFGSGHGGENEILRRVGHCFDTFQNNVCVNDNNNVEICIKVQYILCFMISLH